MGEEPEGRRLRVAGFFDTRAGSVVLLIAVVLLTQAGLVYVAVDQISTTDEPTLIRPARGTHSPRSPISVDADGEPAATAPTAERVPRTVEADEPPRDHGPPGLDVASERRPEKDPVGPGSAPRAGPASPRERPTQASEPKDARPYVRRPTPTSADSTHGDPFGHQERSEETPPDDRSSHHGRHDHGAHDHEPPGRGGGDPGKGHGDDRGGD